MAGARDHEGGGWLVEVYTDEISSPVARPRADPSSARRPGPGPPVTEAVDRLGSLARLARSLVAARSEAEVARIAAAEARFAFGADAASVSRLEPERGLVRTLVNAGSLADWEEAEPADETYRLVDFPLLAAMVEDVVPVDAVRLGPRRPPPRRRALLRGHGSAQRRWPCRSCSRAPSGVSSSSAEAEPPSRSHPTTSTSAWRSPVWSRPGSGQVEHNERVRRLAYSDSLTGLGNRRFIEERLDQALVGAPPRRPPVSLVMADVNGLKAANDRNQSHAEGDAALKAVASALSRATGRAPGSVAGRIGGDEFCAVVEGGLRRRRGPRPGVHADLAADAPHIRGVAVGVASTELSQEPVGREQLLAWADEAQYVAKAAGSLRPVVAGRDEEGQPHERRRWRGSAGADLLPRALELLDQAVRLPTAHRLAALAALLAEEWGASGWVVSAVAGRRRRPRRVAGRPDRHRARVPGARRRSRGCCRAGVHGVELLAGDADVPLADVRGVSRVGRGRRRGLAARAARDRVDDAAGRPAVRAGPRGRRRARLAAGPARPARADRP